MDIAYSRPRFRTDLVAKPFDEAGQRFVDVTDPDSGKTFRFYEVEYSIACAMDGHRDLAGLVEWAQVELGLEPSPDELKTVISTLDDLGYLEEVAAPRGGFALGTAGAGDEPDEMEEETFSTSDDGDEFELGNAGKSPLDRSDDERLDAPELTLGMSGNESVETGPGELRTYDDEMPTTIKKMANLRDSTPDFSDLRTGGGVEPTAVQPMLRPVGRARTGGDEDGPTNIPPPVAEFDEEVSVDLTDHMRIGAADVKEAVRQSKVIQAVEPPQELVERLSSRGLTEAEDDGSATTEHEAPRLAPPPGPALRPQTPPPVRAGSSAGTTELPDTPAFLSDSVSTPVDDSDRAGFRAERSEGVAAPTEKKSRVGLLVLLLLLVAAGAGAAYYFLVFLPSQETTTTEPAQPTTQVPATPEPPPKPAPPSAKLTGVAVPAVPVAAAREGKIKEILASGTEVEENAIVVKLSGDEAFQRKIDTLMIDVERYRKRITENEGKKAEAEAKKPGSGERYQAEVDRTQEKLAKKEEEVEAQRKEMEAFLLRAPIAGKVVTEHAVDQSIAAGDNVFSIELPPRLQATFTIEAGDVPAQGAQVKVAVKGDESKSGTCVVAEAKDKAITVACPGDAPFADGTELVLVQE
jgi:biotin carboxyl carrier protein